MWQVFEETRVGNENQKNREAPEAIKLRNVSGNEEGFRDRRVSHDPGITSLPAWIFSMISTEIQAGKTFTSTLKKWGTELAVSVISHGRSRIGTRLGVICRILKTSN